MKKSFLFAIFISLFFIFNANASNPASPTSDTLTVTFKVKGTAACKSNIEQSVTGQAGVVSASWDATTLQITVIYVHSVVQLTDLYTFLAVAGYDNAELRAKQSVYDALPAACKYTRDPDNE